MAARGSTRARACDNCHSIKIKCELGTTGGSGPCERCTRLGKDCVITPPKSQKDRVAELEAQVTALTKLLETQSIDSRDPNAEVDLGRKGSRDFLTTSQKKRKLEFGLNFNELPRCPDLGELDRIVPKDIQRRLFEKYVNEMVPLIPLVPLANGLTFEQARKTQAVMFITIMHAASTGILREADQDDLGAVVLKTFDTLFNRQGGKSVELIQALQVAVLWYRAPKNHRHVMSFQLAKKAAEIADEIGLWASKDQLSSSCTTTDDSDDPIMALRTRLVCHLLCANIFVIMRNPSFKDTFHVDEFTLHMLGYLESGLGTDRALSHLIQAERLCERIVADLELHDLAVYSEVSQLDTQFKIHRLQNAVTDWQSQATLTKPGPFIASYEHLATLLNHEIVLHTATNKYSFAAPFLAERLSVTDFPAPFVTPQHVASLYSLKSAAHALLDSYAQLNINTWGSLSFLLCVGRVAYAEYILVKLYIATTAVGNTFGAFLTPEDLEVEKYLDQLIQIASKVQAIDSNCPGARILQALVHVKEWLRNYKAERADSAFASPSPEYISKDGASSPQNVELVDWNGLALNYNGLDFELDPLLADSATQGLFNQSTFLDGYSPLQTGTGP